MLSQANCRYIKAPALAALLPKLHINRHAPRVVVFGGKIFGGLGLKDYFIDQGYQQLRYLVGHIKLNDDVGQQFLILLSYVQLLTRTSTSVFHQPYQLFKPWTEHTWVSTLWEFCTALKLSITFEDPWLPTLSRTHNIFLMEEALRLHLATHILQDINQCLIFLQVITLSDITTVDGRYLLPEAIQGLPIQDRLNNLTWPHQQHLPPRSWTHWRTFLQFFCTGNRLRTPLGAWINMPHQRWRWYYNSADSLLYHQLSDDTWEVLAPTYTSTRRTRHSRAQYRAPTPCPPPSFHQFFPASVTTSSNFTHSNSSFKVPSPPPPTTLWVTPSPSPFLHTPIFFQRLIGPNPPSKESCSAVAEAIVQASLIGPSPSPFLHTPIFFQRLIGPNPPSEESCSAIAEAIVQASLIACSDGSCNSGIGSHGWVFASVRGTIISSGAGPVDGHPSLMSSYRSEASGIAATLCIILKICHHYEITRGLVLCYCDSKGVLNNIYKKCQRGITPFLNTDYDLVHLCHTLLADIPIEIRGEWVKGHHYPRQMEPKYEINHLADANAIKFSSSPAPSFTPRKLPLSYPGFRVQLHCDNSIITSNLYQT
jgi:hypothetical protein